MPRLPLLLILLFPPALLLYATPHGLGLSPDSAYYLHAARAIAGHEPASADGSPWQPSAHFPPLYPIALAASSLGLFDPLQTALPLNILLLITSAILVDALCNSERRPCHSERSEESPPQEALAPRVPPSSIFHFPFAILLPLAFLLATPTLATHTSLLSEPLFLTLLLLTILAFQRNHLLLSALLASLACFTRYAALALIAAAVLHLLLSRRFRHAILFALVSLAPLALLALANRIRQGAAVNRPLAFHPISLAHLSDAASTVGQWFSPDPLARPLGALLLTALLIAAALALFRANLRLIALTILCYIALLILSISFLDHHTQLDDRILFPLLPLALILIAPLLARPALRYLLLIPLIALPLRSLPMLQQFHSSGIGYASPAWQSSPLLQSVKTLRPDALIYSNAVDVLYLLAHRESFAIPPKLDATANRPNPDYATSLDQLRSDLLRRRALIVYFKRFAARRSYYPSADELKKSLGLHPLTRAADGIIYDYVPAPATIPTK